MLNLEEVLKTFNDPTFDGRLTNRLVLFVRYDQLNLLGVKLKDNVTAAKWDVNVRPFTRENVLSQLKEDVAFGFEKALDKRGISSGLMYEVVLFWNKVLQEGLENWDKENYPCYGLPLFKATAIKYGWDNPIGDDNGDEQCYMDNFQDKIY